MGRREEGEEGREWGVRGGGEEGGREGREWGGVKRGKRNFPFIVRTVCTYV